MTTKMIAAAAALMAVLAASGVSAQGMGGGPGVGRTNMDCTHALNPELCAARQQAGEACKGMRGPARRECIAERMPPDVCTKAKDPALCEVHKKAFDSCKARMGPAFRNCMQEHGAPVPRPRAAQ